MTRRIIALQEIFSIALAFAIFFLALLPSLGWAWHSVLPEHQHWFVGTLHEDIPNTPTPTSPSDWGDSTLTGDGLTIVHLPSFDALQVIVIAIELPVGYPIPIPEEFPSKITFDSFTPSLVSLLLLDPPPKAR